MWHSVSLRNGTPGPGDGLDLASWLVLHWHSYWYLTDTAREQYSTSVVLAKS